MQYWNRFLGRRVEGEESLIEAENKKSHDIFKNRLLLTSLLNLLNFLAFVFAMAYYNWATAQLPLEAGEQSIYVNLLYGKQIGSSQY